MKRIALLAVLVALVCTPALAQKTLVSLGSSNTETFTGYEGLGMAPAPPAGWLDSNEFSVTGVDEADTGTDGTCHFGETCPEPGSQDVAKTDYGRGISVGNAQLAGGVYAFDHGGDVGMGWQAKANKDFSPGSITVKYRNDTGLSVGSIEVAYDAWYLNSDSGSHLMGFSYATGSCTGSGDAYTGIPGFDVVTPEDEDLSPVWVSTPLSSAITLPTLLAPGDCFFIRFTGDTGVGGANQDEVAVDDISVTPLSAAPDANFTFSQINGTLEMDFDASGSTDDGTIVTYDWDFGDGLSGSGVATSHVYNAPGLYTVTLSVVDDAGLGDNVTMDVLVADPFAPFLESDGIVVIEAENFFTNTDRSGHSWINTTDQGGYSGAAAMYGDPDDGDAFNGPTILEAPELTYDVDFTTTGLYRIWFRLYALDDGDNSLHAGLDGATSATKMSTDDLGAWVWTNVDTKGRTKSLNVGTEGVHSVNVWMREDGLYVDKILLTTDTGFVPVGIGPNESPREGFDAPPTASFTATPGAADLDMDFDATASSDDGVIETYDWDFGDGQTGTGAVVTHTYGAAGLYTITLTVTDDGGQQGVTSQDLTVGTINEPPVAAFTAVPVTGTLDVDFDAAGSTDDVSIVSYDWDFGDGATGTGQTVTHAYGAPGTYTASLTVTDGGGLSDVETMDVTVFDPGAVGAFLESGGIVVMEAEHFFTNVARSDHSWVVSTEATGFSGESSMAADPDDGSLFKKNNTANSPEMTFDVDFSTTGSYYFWVRVKALDNGDNSLHGGANGAVSASKLTVDALGDWTWTDVNNKGARQTIGINTVGLSTVHIWMREDGIYLDKIVLTTDPDFVPVDLGPVESPRNTTSPDESLASGHSAAFTEFELLPDAFALDGNYPNPFRDVTTIRYAMPEAGYVRLEVYDLLGRRVARLVEGPRDAGRHQASWDGTHDSGGSIASGLYLYRITIGDYSDTGTMLLRR